MSAHLGRATSRALAALGLLLAAAGPAAAQMMGVPGLGPATPQMAEFLANAAGAATTASAASGAPGTDPAEQGPAPRGTTDVSFIDSAIPFGSFRLIYDRSERDNRPTRAEFLYPKGGFPFNHGPPLPETRVDAQQFSAYLETAIGDSFSVFFLTPYKWVNPEVNRNESGFGDYELGFKYAFIATQPLTATFQLRVVMPARSGSELSTYHWSAEPALLLNFSPLEYVTLEGELRYWASIGGSEFAGDVVRYGLGLAYGEHLQQGLWINPVAEVVGWTVVSGKEMVVWSPTDLAVRNAGGETIVNGYLGVRVGWGPALQLYAGYGRSLTGDVWYKQTYRVELRLAF
jgi:hypothetical protein